MFLNLINSCLLWKAKHKPREINLFYHENNRRERVKYNGDSYQIGKSEFTSDELVVKSKSDVERFSPNVSARPLFQETYYLIWLTLEALQN